MKGDVRTTYQRIQRDAPTIPDQLWMQFIYAYMAAVWVRRDHEQGNASDAELSLAASNLYYANDQLGKTAGGVPPVVLEDALLLALWKDTPDA